VPLFRVELCSANGVSCLKEDVAGISSFVHVQNVALALPTFNNEASRDELYDGMSSLSAGLSLSAGSTEQQRAGQLDHVEILLLSASWRTDQRP
jgi:hypothetical protein